MSEFTINSLDNVASDYVFLTDLIEVLVSHHVLPEGTLRNIKIKRDYRVLIAEGNSGKDALEKIAEKYYITTKGVEAIIYQKLCNKM